MTVPRVSVLMSVFNAERHARRAIDSILSQDERRLELVIVDDGSTDGTPALLRSYADERIRIVSQRNTGLTAALNRGLGLVRAPYVARIDADDVARPQRISRQADLLDAQPDLVLCGTWADIVDDRDRLLERARPPVDDAAIRAQLLWDNAFFHSTWMVRADALRRVGYYDDRVARAQDYELAWRLSREGRLGNVPVALLAWRRSREGISVRHRDAQRRSVGTTSLRALETHLGRPLDQAWFWRMRELWDGARDRIDAGDAMALARLLPDLPPAASRTVIVDLIALAAAASGLGERLDLLGAAWRAMPGARGRLIAPKRSLRAAAGPLGLRIARGMRRVARGY